LLIGGGIGAVIALLFAPKSGVELRGDIADATRKGIEKGKEAASQLQEAAGDYYEVGREKASEYYQTGKEKATELTDKAKAAAARTTNPFSAAIEAGKEAYTAEKRRNEVKSISEGRPEWPVDEKGEA
jgi:gas vesicle protein